MKQEQQPDKPDRRVMAQLLLLIAAVIVFTSDTTSLALRMIAFGIILRVGYHFGRSVNDKQGGAA